MQYSHAQTLFQRAGAMIHNQSDNPNPQSTAKAGPAADGFALIGALLMVTLMSISIPQLLKLVSDVERISGSGQARIDAQSMSKSLFSATHAQLIANTGLPQNWHRGDTITLAQENRAYACFRLMADEDTARNELMLTWLSKRGRFSEILHNDADIGGIANDNGTYSFSAVYFDNATDTALKAYDTFQILGCHVRGQPFTTAAISFGTYTYAGGRLRLIALNNNSL